VTLSFWKVPFSAQEVLDLAGDCDGLREFVARFCVMAEARSRQAPPPCTDDDGQWEPMVRRPPGS
jgi:hypothetical protein